MSPSVKQLKTCEKGHKYYKSGDCLTCPVCEQEKKPLAGFLAILSAPARRALENAGLTTLKKIAKWTEEDLLKLHGMGPSSIPKLLQALKADGLAFKESKASRKTSKASDIKEVELFIKKLEPEISQAVQLIRKIILSSHPDVGERIKWNHPSFYYTGGMNPSDPKEYKREIAVFNLYKGRILLVLPSGAKVKDSSGILEGDFKDGRRVIHFKNYADAKSKAKALRAVIQKWIQTTEKDR